MSSVSERIDRTAEKIREVEKALVYVRQVHSESAGKPELFWLSHFCRQDIERLERRLKVLNKRFLARQLGQLEKVK